MRIFFILLSLLTGGCVHSPSMQEIQNADYGTYPDKYQDITKEYITQAMYDPDSAMFTNWREPKKDYVSDINGSVFGYKVCVSVNGKNRLGGYAGYQPYYIFIRNNRVLIANNKYMAYEKCIKK